MNIPVNGPSVVELQELARATALVHEPDEDPVWADSRDEDLYDLVVNRGMDLLLVARNSTSASRRGCIAAAEDLLGNVEALARIAGFDVRGCLPSVEVLAEWLFSSPYKIVSNDGSGEVFLNRFRLIRIPRANVTISLSAGTAVKLDATSLEQPHAEHQKRTLLDTELNLCGVFAKRFDRLTRSTWAAGRILESMKTLAARNGAAWGGDGEFGRWDLEDFADVLFALRGHGAGTEAKNMVKKRKFAMIRNTGPEMVDGRVEFPFAQGCPPGTMRYRDRRSGISWLTFDSPDFYPSVVDAEGLPEVRTEDGERVDQTRVIQWFLARLGKPEYPIEDLVQELIARRFSTESLRLMRQNGPAAHYGFTRASGSKHEVQVSRVLDWVATYLDFYRDGVLHPSVNKTVLTVQGIKPPGGEWLTREDYERIKLYLGQRRKPGRRPAGSWAGMPCTINGKPGYLQAVDVNGVPSWRMRLKSPGSAGEGECGTDAFAVPDDLADTGVDPSNEGPSSSVPVQSQGDRIASVHDTALVSAIVEAILAADGQPLVPLLDDDSAATARRAERFRLRSVESEIEVLEAELDRLGELLLSQRPDGTPKLGPGLWERASQRVERETERLKRLQAEAMALAYGMRAADELLGLDAEAMTMLVEGLRDPGANRIRAFLRRAVHDLHFSTERYQVRRQDGVRVSFAGRLVFKTQDGPQALAFTGTYERGAATLLDGRALEALTRLRDGNVSRNVERGLVRQMNGAVAALLGIAGEQFVMGNCADPNLVKIGMAALYPDPVPGEDPAQVPRLEDLARDPGLQADFGDVMALAESIRRAHGPAKRAAWLTTSSPRELSAAIVACAQGRPAAMKRSGPGRAARLRTAAHRWAFSDSRTVTFAPCRHCGNAYCAPTRMSEVTGYLCLEPTCRRDDAGVRWDTRFDIFVDHTDLWLEAGVALAVAPGFTLDPKVVAGALQAPLCKPRALRRVGPEVAEAAVEDYVNTTEPVKKIAANHGISVGSVYDALRRRGIALRGAAEGSG